MDYQPDNELTSRVIESIIRVHQAMGPGFVESIYRRALLIELCAHGLVVDSEKQVLVYYAGHIVGRHRLDLLVAGQLILELKTVETLSKAHYAQVRSYLRASGLGLAFLVNFAGNRADFRRIEVPTYLPSRIDPEPLS